MNRTHLMSFAAIAALSMFNGVARADEGSGDFLAALIADSGVRYENNGPVTCADVTRDAWFLRQMAITDGDADPQIAPTVECQRDNEFVASAPSQDD